MTLHERFRKYMETMVNMLTVNGNQYKLFGLCVETYFFRQMDNRGRGGSTTKQIEIIVLKFA